jgi:DNA repair protein RecN (Recombination protein N)
MLSRLSIQHLAIVEDVTVEFEAGFNVLTGETGAGKSILIGAISLLAGKKAPSDIVRQGYQQSFVEGVLTLSADSPAWGLLEEVGIVCNDDQIILKRILSEQGKNRVLINQQASTVTVLSKLAAHWLDVTGQHAQHDLLDPMMHLSILDQFIDQPEAMHAYSQHFAALNKVQNQLKALEKQKAKAEQEKDFLTFQLEELTQASLKEGELEELQSHFQRMKNSHEIKQHTMEAKRLFQSDDGILERMDKVQQRVAKLSAIDPSFETLVQDLETAAIGLEEAAQQIETSTRNLNFSDREMDEMNERVSFLQTIVRKHGSIEQAIEKRDQLAQTLDLLSEDSDQTWALEQEVQRLEKEVVKAASEITRIRKKNAPLLAEKITTELAQLGMGQAILRIDLSPWSSDVPTVKISGETFHSSGPQQAQLMFCPNPGEGFKPLSNIASGGELSRILLAIKSISTQKNNQQNVTYLFDEVDTGMGGETAERIGQRMRVLSDKGTQVLSVTHLAQVAVYAHQHMRVEKNVLDQRTQTQVVALTAAQRKQEVARMIGGIDLTKQTHAFAKELFERSQKRVLS